MRAVRYEPWGGPGCPWSLTKDLWGERPAAVFAQAGRALKVLAWFTGRCWANAKHDCDTVRIRSWFQYLLLRTGKDFIFFLRICSLARFGEGILLGNEWGHILLMEVLYFSLSVPS